jgi:hypothetical protein
MKLDNLVIEELSRMKSLFGYERGKVISEQEIQELGGMGSAGYYYSQAQQKKSVKPAAPAPIPTELKDIEGVKKFQDWLDTNKKGWASGYANGILNKIGKGYGRMGPRTNKAWGLYKDEFSNPTDKVEPITSQEITTINASLMKPGETSNDYFKNPDGKIKVNDLEPVTVSATRKKPAVVTNPNQDVTTEKPTELGQPGEYRDGWYFDEKSQDWFQPQ